jgi:hypothetical protein
MRRFESEDGTHCGDGGNTFAGESCWEETSSPGDFGLVFSYDPASSLHCRSW